MSEEKPQRAPSRRNDRRSHPLCTPPRRRGFPILSIGQTRRARQLIGASLAALVLVSLSPAPGRAFPHILQEDETLADLAERYYGKMQNEGLIAQANQLNNQTPSKKIALTPGMVLEIPAPRFLRVTEGETWKSLAEQWLGHEGRAFVLADMNGFKPWHEPEAGQLVVLPYPLIWRSTGNESIAALAYRYLGSTKFAYRLMQFNQLKKDRPDPGTVLLLPIVDLELSPEGRNAAVLAGQMLSQQAAGAQKSDQDELSESLRRLRLELSTGNYVAAVALGNQMLASNVASETTGAKIHQALLESYVALGGAALARESCEELRRLAPDTHLDPLYTSPKIIAICPNPTP